MAAAMSRVARPEPGIIATRSMPALAVWWSQVVNRVATFVFQIDERFFGTITAFVPGAEAENYRFTSGLPVRAASGPDAHAIALIDRPPGAAQACTPGSDSPGCEHPGG